MNKAVFQRGLGMVLDYMIAHVDEKPKLSVIFLRRNFNLLLVEPLLEANGGDRQTPLPSIRSFPAYRDSDGTIRINLPKPLIYKEDTKYDRILKQV